MSRGTLVTVAILAALTAGCHRAPSKEAQLKALDEAYQSGVFTKEEYDAKKQAIVGPAAAPPPASTPTPAPAAPPPPEVAPASVPPPDATPPPVAAPPPVQQAAPAPAPVQPVQAPPTQPPPQAAPPPVAAPPPAAPPPAVAAPAQQAAEPEPAPLTGCQDAESRAGGPNGVQERFYPASEDRVRSAAIQAFANLGFTLHNSTAHDMEASKKGKLNTVVGTGTERVILHFASAHRNGQTGTKVVGETKRGFMGHVTQKSWTSAVLAQIACNLRR